MKMTRGMKKRSNNESKGRREWETKDWEEGNNYKKVMKGKKNTRK